MYVGRLSRYRLKVDARYYYTIVICFVRQNLCNKWSTIGQHRDVVVFQKRNTFKTYLFLISMFVSAWITSHNGRPPVIRYYSLVLLAV